MFLTEGRGLIFVGSPSMPVLRDQKLSRNMCEPSLIATQKIRVRIHSTMMCAMQQHSCTHSEYTRCRDLSCFHNASAYHPRAHACLQELLERYNPLHGLSTEERVKKTANRVGLDMPIAKDED